MSHPSSGSSVRQVGFTKSSERTVVTRLPLRLEVRSLAGNVSVQNSIPSNQSTARDKTVADSVSTIPRIPLSPMNM